MHEADGAWCADIDALGLNLLPGERRCQSGDPARTMPICSLGGSEMARRLELGTQPMLLQPAC